VPFREYSLNGRLAPVKTISVMNNLTQSYQTTEELSSRYKTETITLPDIVVIVDDLEKFFTSGSGVISGTNLKLKYNLSKSEVIGTEYKEDAAYGGDLRFLLFNHFDSNLSYSEQTLDKTDVRVNAPLENYLRRDFTAQTSFNYKRVKFTPKFSYIYDTRTQVNNVLIDDVEELVPSLNIRADFNLPYGIKIPFITRRYLMTNRVIWNTNISYSRRRSFTVTENRNLFDINTNFDYEISKNLRFTLTGAYQRFEHIYIPEESYDAYTIGTLLTIQF
jgi:hypothetical protein